MVRGVNACVTRNSNEGDVAMNWKLTAALLSVLALAACGGKAPAPGPSSTGAGGAALSGNHDDDGGDPETNDDQESKGDGGATEQEDKGTDTADNAAQGPDTETNDDDGGPHH